MTPSEAAKLLGHAAAFDRRTVGEVDALAWAEALHDLPVDTDTFAAVARFYGTAPRDGESRKWIEPHHVRTMRKAIRAERIPDGVVAYTLPAGPETGGEFVQRRRAQISAIADGRATAQPIRQLKGGPHQSVADAMAAIGRIPEHLRPELAEAGIGRRRAQWPELAIPCPLHVCRALAGRECRTASGRRMNLGTHPSRREAWNAQRTDASA